MISSQLIEMKVDFLIVIFIVHKIMLCIGLGIVQLIELN
jgi:hypothetical protein